MHTHPLFPLAKAIPLALCCGQYKTLYSMCSAAFRDEVSLEEFVSFASDFQRDGTPYAEQPLSVVPLAGMSRFVWTTSNGQKGLSAAIDSQGTTGSQPGMCSGGAGTRAIPAKRICIFKSPTPSTRTPPSRFRSGFSRTLRSSKGCLSVADSPIADSLASRLENLAAQFLSVQKKSGSHPALSVFYSLPPLAKYA